VLLLDLGRQTVALLSEPLDLARKILVAHGR
jgi:hypothetical protein